MDEEKLTLEKAWILHPLGICSWTQDTAHGWEIILINGLPNFAHLVDEVLQVPCGL
jgi:hypothetical protein